MSLYDYKKSHEISALEPTFASIIMAAARKADSFNIERLRYCFPQIISEFEARYVAPGGVPLFTILEELGTQGGAGIDAPERGTSGDSAP